MNIARPSDGFRIILAPTVRAHLDSILATHQEFAWRWESVTLRLRFTGHREGASATGNPSERVGVFELNEWRVMLAWRVVGDTVNILKADF